MKTLWQDVRYGARMLLKAPGFTAVAVFALALGIGANTAIFSVVNTVLLRPLPFENSEGLVRVYVTDLKRGANSYPTSYPNFKDWQAGNHVFESVTAYGETSMTLTGADAPALLDGIITTTELFQTLSAQPLLGRSFLPEEGQAGGGGARVVVLSHGMWQRRFGADRNIIGRQIALDGRSTTVVGVMPQGFVFPLNAEETEFWIPLDPSEVGNAERGSNYLSVVARLKKGATLEQAEAEMQTIARRLEGQYPATNTGRNIRLVSMYEDTVG
ncbi:MAG: ABC transporter permease, partial [Pyrinomonadaceae bacterium]